MDPFCMATTSPVGLKTNPAILAEAAAAAEAIDTILSGSSLGSNESWFVFDFDQMSKWPDSSLETMRFDVGSSFTVNIMQKKLAL